MAVAYAWFPKALGALGTGRVAWLEVVWRNTCFGVTIYQSDKLLTESRGENWKEAEEKDCSYLIYLWLRKVFTGKGE